MSFGPPRDGRATFQRLDRNPRWAGVPDLEEAGTASGRGLLPSVRAGAGSTTSTTGSATGSVPGGSGSRRGSPRFGDRLATVDIDGEPAYVMRDDLEELAATRPNASVRLLPGFDQWVLGPGTADAHIVPPGKRAVVTRGANIVIVGGVVSGTWTLADDSVAIVWFAQERPTTKALAEEVARLATILDRPLLSSVETA